MTEGVFPKSDGEILYASEVNEFAYKTDNYYPFLLTKVQGGIGSGTITYASNYCTVTSSDGANNIYAQSQVETPINNRTIIFTIKYSGTPNTTNINTWGFNDLYVDLIGSSVTFKTKNGGTESTDISSGIDLTADSEIKIEHLGTSIKCYVDDVLKATHTTNIPTAVSPTFFVASYKGNASTNMVSYFKLNSYRNYKNGS